MFFHLQLSTGQCPVLGLDPAADRTNLQQNCDYAVRSLQKDRRKVSQYWQTNSVCSESFQINLVVASDALRTYQGLVQVCQRF